MQSENYRSDDAAEYIGIAPPTLAKMRMRGDGPKYSKISNRLIIYRKADMDEWLESKQFNSTSEYAEV